MDLFHLLGEMIDMRSFSNLWYWIALAVAWSTASHWILGVPFDLINRARRKGGQAYDDMLALVHINVARRLHIVEIAGIWLVAAGCFVLSGLAVLGFWFKIEFAQAVFLIMFPMTLVSLLALRTAARIKTADSVGDELFRELHFCRFVTQIIGVISIFVTSMWGMAQNLQIGAI